ncbi:Protein disulfide-isomerase [Monocercomonoides exilis]|uniref:Protein disulfide-isomerase n=1 Tax=Monocercomonoides exilis TaxID=2049356 RepID=UPI0035596633|nr:Protein disulfide-isomerase [Monocercomonoides exilis]|eukprot:MONOS_9948.1-p1 / transcript=MONOS_9948.1 / gene=MONOS_9948 / organism=Monocercomonoides_exilis_PA203 / gene_product=Protein disulfide-isomerase / transcript_product=Protein disulfide-isomerase / location=Mono_scaffold00430:14855-18058(+) / protein_length=769 / sequence_SO=supercontig / SO=protein_coding / is_pseudo=false
MNFLIFIKIGMDQMPEYDANGNPVEFEQKTEMVERITSENIDSFKQKSKTHFILFYISGCRHCKAFFPIYEQFAIKFSETMNSITFGQINCDSNPRLCSAYRVKLYPTLLLEIENERKEYDGKRTINSKICFTSENEKKEDQELDISIESERKLSTPTKESFIDGSISNEIKVFDNCSESNPNEVPIDLQLGGKPLFYTTKKHSDSYPSLPLKEDIENEETNVDENDFDINISLRPSSASEVFHKSLESKRNEQKDVGKSISDKNSPPEQPMEIPITRKHENSIFQARKTKVAPKVKTFSKRQSLFTRSDLALERCKICGRSFATDRLEIHQAICELHPPKEVQNKENATDKDKQRDKDVERAKDKEGDPAPIATAYDTKRRSSLISSQLSVANASYSQIARRSQMQSNSPKMRHFPGAHSSANHFTNPPQHSQSSSLSAPNLQLPSSASQSGPSSSSSSSTSIATSAFLSSPLNHTHNSQSSAAGTKLQTQKKEKAFSVKPNTSAISSSTSSMQLKHDSSLHRNTQQNTFQPSQRNQKQQKNTKQIIKGLPLFVQNFGREICLGEALYDSLTTTVGDLAFIVEEQMGKSIKSDSLLKNGIIPIHPAQHSFLLADVFRKDDDRALVELDSDWTPAANTCSPAMQLSPFLSSAPLIGVSAASRIEIPEERKNSISDSLHSLSTSQAFAQMNPAPQTCSQNVLDTCASLHNVLGTEKCSDAAEKETSSSTVWKSSASSELLLEKSKTRRNSALGIEDLDNRTSSILDNET